VPPLCLNEGFADYLSNRAVFEKMRLDNGKIKLVKPIPENNYIPLGKLVDAADYPQEHLDIFYLENEALVRYLILNFGGDRFYKLLRQCAQGKPFREVYHVVYDDRFDTLEQNFKAYVIKKAA
jgi:hypothetical protein